MMAPVLRFWKAYVKWAKFSLPFEAANGKKADEIPGIDAFNKNRGSSNNESSSSRRNRSENQELRKCRCFDWCCWMIGYTCTAWWLLMLLYSSLPVSLTGFCFPVPGSPGAKLKKEGLKPLHPVVFVPGIVTGGLELWEGRPCSEGLFRKRLWGGSFTHMFKRPLCWLEHMSLDNETGLDPPGIRVRPVPGLVAADYFATGYFVWAVLIENLARIGYDEKNMHMAAYDWRLSFQNTEVRDHALSTLKSRIELMVRMNGNRKVVVVPHSTGVLYFLHFLKWVEAPAPMGGGGGARWCAKHIKAVMNIGPAFLGVPKAVSAIFSAEAKDIAVARAMAPGVLDSKFLGAQTHIMRVLRTWDSILSLLPKGGEAIWGDLNWSPEEGCDCRLVNKKYPKVPFLSYPTNTNDENMSLKVGKAYFGRLISFGKKTSQLQSFGLLSVNPKGLWRTGVPHKPNSSCGEVWTEYDEMNRESIEAVAENKVYTAATVVDLLHYVAPKLMRRAGVHFSHGIANNIDDPKYSHSKLPDAPDMEIYCLYGVGIPTERSYVYKISPSERCNNIPFQIDSWANGSDDWCLKGGVYFVDGDGSIPALSSGFMCASGWRERSKFNPSGMATFVREYQHKPPANLLEGRGLESGAHVDIMGNVALIEDIMRVAAGATGSEIGGDRIYSDILKMSKRISLRL